MALSVKPVNPVKYLQIDTIYHAQKHLRGGEEYGDRMLALILTYPKPNPKP